MKTRELLADLVAFNTVSHLSNVDLIDYIARYLAHHGVGSTIVPSPDGQKASLYATIGPSAPSGIILSGHTDVVPATPDGWHSPPFALTARDWRYYGRGTADMKGFIACALAAVPAWLQENLQAPVHLALSHDEETGCLGAPALIAHMREHIQAPAACVVGEPTSMRIAVAHKGTQAFRVCASGTPGHSSLAPHLLNPIYPMAELALALRDASQHFRMHGPRDAGFEVPHTTVHVGRMQGGEQVNIVPRQCAMDVEIRHLPGSDAADLCRALLDAPMMKFAQAAREAGVAVPTVETMYAYPALDTPPGSDFVTRLKALLRTGEHIKVAYGTEAGLFQQGLDIPTVVCGPGSIEQAHQPNEYISEQQLRECEAFMRSLPCLLAEVERI